MKVLVEVSYILNEEPEEFKQISDVNSRTVYLWLNRRGYLIDSSTCSPWQTFSRLSIMDTKPDNSFMEVWSDDKHDIGDPPNNADDMWSESYKTIDKTHYVLEWHAKLNQLRIIWHQSISTLKDNKIIAQVMSEITNLDAGFPNYPTIVD
jgi:hypothetical protein